MDKKTPPVKKPVKKLEFKLKFNLKNLLLWLFLGWIFLSMLVGWRSGRPDEEKIPLSEVLGEIKAGRVERVEVQDSQLKVFYPEGDYKVSQKETGISFTEILKSAEISPE